ncbi:General secretion pathway protein F [Klebsiella pneumoniae IS22]|nr:General secretion pathway protein F [Klebsiella pneumoniae IS22]
MNYRYRAMTQDGQKLQGIIDANDERQARLRLREEGLFLLDIRPQKSSGVKTRRPRISHSELTLFTRQLATLSAAALPLEESLAVIGQQSSNKRLGDVLNQVRSAILEGHPLSDALQHFPTLFDSLYRTLVKAGEKSGLLAPVLEKLADYNENRQKIRSKLIQSLIYPLYAHYGGDWGRDYSPHCCRAQNYRTVRAYEAATAAEYTHSFRSERHVATYRPDIISDSVYCRCRFLALVKTRQ